MSEGHFEAKVERRAENAKGIFITFLVQPHDHDTALAQLRVGAAVQIGWAEIVDVGVQPIEQPSRGDESHARASSSREPAEAQDVSPRAVEDSGHSKPPLALSSQCALRCKDKRFQEWFKETYRVAFATDDGCANAVRMVIGIASRAELDSDASTAGHWKALEERFQHHLTSQMHAGSYR